MYILIDGFGSWIPRRKLVKIAWVIADVIITFVSSRSRQPPHLPPFGNSLLCYVPLFGPGGLKTTLQNMLLCLCISLPCQCQGNDLATAALIHIDSQLEPSEKESTNNERGGICVYAL